MHAALPANVGSAPNTGPTHMPTPWAWALLASGIWSPSSAWDSSSLFLPSLGTRAPMQRGINRRMQLGCCTRSSMQPQT